jgi:hypothetical protein
VERWPEVAHLLANDPRLEADCRNATTKEALNAAVARAIPGFDAGDDLFKVLKGNPPLANVLQRVVYYE